MKQESLSMCTKTSIEQRWPADYDDKIVKFHKFVRHARKRSSFELGQIGNMDDVPSNKTEYEGIQVYYNKNHKPWEDPLIGFTYMLRWWHKTDPFSDF